MCMGEHVCAGVHVKARELTTSDVIPQSPFVFGGAGLSLALELTKQDRLAGWAVSPWVYLSHFAFPALGSQAQTITPRFL